MDILIENEQNIRLGVSVGLLALFAAIEFIAPLAKRRTGRPFQWFTNFSIIIIDTAILRLLFPLLAVGVALYAHENSIGLFNIIELNDWAVLFISLLALDLLIYGQHVLVHKVPILWRLHRMHHTEIGLDVTSANRFHPIEIILSMLIKMGFVLIMGVPVAAVILFEILLNGLALFNHSNIRLPRMLEKLLRIVFITPEIHWIHHSEIVAETNSNYGFNLCIWDKIFGTYIDKPTLEYSEMQQGLSEFGFDKSLNFVELIISPFKNYSAPEDEHRP